MKYFIILTLLATSIPTIADTTPLSSYSDPRFQGFVIRDKNGRIKRSRAVLRKFQKIHPCPSTGLTTGKCPGWSLDHVYSLACGGVDDIINLQWMPYAIKTCKQPYCKDRYERKIIHHDYIVPGMKNRYCSPSIIKFK